jgi:hypothetical protein
MWEEQKEDTQQILFFKRACALGDDEPEPWVEVAGEISVKLREKVFTLKKKICVVLGVKPEPHARQVFYH